jgi:two-component sensor histidine kinase
VLAAQLIPGAQMPFDRFWRRVFVNQSAHQSIQLSRKFYLELSNCGQCLTGERLDYSGFRLQLEPIMVSLDQESVPKLGRQGVGPLAENHSAPQKSLRNSMAFALMAMAREPFMILDRSLRVVAASRSYYKLFPIRIAAHRGKFICEPSSLQWDALALKPLQDAISFNEVIEDYQVELDVPNVGRRSMLLNVRQASDHASPDSAMLVGLEDITESRDVRQRQKAQERLQAALLAEVHHRVANNLQMIASILSIKAVRAGSRETQIALQDALNRLRLVAALERQLCAPGLADEIQFAPYLAQLCADLAGAVLADDISVAITSSSRLGNVKSDEAASMGMIVTELVSNALEHGFPDDRSGRIAVDFALNDQGWRLSVTDDGVGRSSERELVSARGVGTKIVDALAQHLNARVEMFEGTPGTVVAIVYGRQERISS